MLRLPDAWTWDFWIADTGAEYHLLFLYASRALHEPDRRHVRASIGHAVSTDLTTWTRVADALVRGDAPAFDDVATWTGSVLRGPDGVWRMFYTGATRRAEALIQSIGVATSTDLVTWHKHPGNPVLTADPRWYERYGDSTWFDEAWRDPWVFPDPGGDGWHMLITARANHGPTICCTGRPSRRSAIPVADSASSRSSRSRSSTAAPSCSSRVCAASSAASGENRAPPGGSGR